MRNSEAVSDRAPSSPSGGNIRSILVAAVLFYLFFKGQVYISSTLAGTRMRQAVNLPGASDTGLWSACAPYLSSGLSDIGEAGAVWLQSAFVGSPPDEKDVVSPKTTRYQCRCQLPEVYTGPKPRLGAIIQSFNHRANIYNISTGLKSSELVEEIAVCEDGSTDGSLEEWARVLTGPNQFVIRSNNLHELRSYNRAMRMTDADIVVLLQDDDLLPANDEWLQNAFRLFDTIPDLGVLGGYIGQLWDPTTGAGFEFGEQMSTHGGVRKGNTKPIAFVEPRTRIPFMYTECVWIAPVFIRRSLLRKAGGLELAIAKVGEPGVWQDCVFSYEAWVNGYSVGVFSAPFERGVGGHGSATSKEKLLKRDRVWERAVAYTNRKYSRRRIHSIVKSKNRDYLKVRKVADVTA